MELPDRTIWQFPTRHRLTARTTTGGAVMVEKVADVVSDMMDCTFYRRNRVGAVAVPASFDLIGNQERGRKSYCDHQHTKPFEVHDHLSAICYIQRAEVLYAVVAFFRRETTFCSALTSGTT
jgi:hypothetical protein